MRGMMLACVVHLLAQLGGNFWRVGRSGAEHDLGLRRQVADGIDEMSDALLAGDAADKQDVRKSRIDSVVR